MLTMLEYADRGKQGAFKSLFTKLKGEDVKAHAHRAMNTGFVRITAQRADGEVNWRRVCEFSEDPSLRLLMPKDELPPPKSGIKRFYSREFRRRMLENLAIEALILSDKPVREKRVLLAGAEAETAVLAPRLAPLVGEMRIISNRPYALSDVAEWLREEHGLELTLTNNPNAAGFELVVAPGGLGEAFRADANAVVLSPDKPRDECRLWVSDCCCELPAALEAHWMPCYDKTEFVAAFYEIAGVRKLAGVLPRCGISCGEELSGEFIAKLI